MLTDELRELREELRNMVARPKRNPTRAFLHRQSWPPSRPAPSEPEGMANDDEPRVGRSRKKR